MISSPTECKEALRTMTAAMNRQAILVYTTVADRDTASSLAELLVEARLAACVHVVPGIRSVYRWQGKVQRDEEVQLVIKSEVSRFDAIAALLREHHPYELPEVLSVRVDRGSHEYLDWITRETAPGASKEIDP